jgi:hypothetical protein
MNEYKNWLLCRYETTTSTVYLQAARWVLRARDRIKGPLYSSDELRKSLLAIGGWGNEGQEVDEFRAALVMLTPTVIGSMDVVEVSRFCDVPLDEVKTYAARLKANRIWRKDGTCCGSWHEPVAIIMDALVAAGKLGLRTKRRSPGGRSTDRKMNNSQR